MPWFRPLLCCLLTLAGSAQPEGTVRRYRQWMGGEEVGGATQTVRQDGATREVRSSEWMELARLGQGIRQTLDQTARRGPDGILAFTWRLQMSAEPFAGTARWSPRDPGVVVLQTARGPEVRKEVPPGACLWPGDLDDRLADAARNGRNVKAVTFSFPVQGWESVDLVHRGPAPLPGFPDAVRFEGTETQGTVALPVEVWISPAEGEVRHITNLGTMVLTTQRAELPPPARPAGGAAGFFEQTLQTLPPHPFEAWLGDAVLRAEGPPPQLADDAQQVRLAGGRWRLQRAAPPSAAEAAQPPVTGTPGPAEAPYLAPSDLVPFRDPAFAPLLKRLGLPPGLSRWEIARRVTAFVFEWITEKDYTVGFASALEVARTPRGDCTEHGVLAVALLRRLGVPARGVTGWVALDRTLGLHFWVEVRLGDRWIPVDPTFDQAPAGALRLKLGDCTLADLGSVGWEAAALALGGLRWVPESTGGRPYAEGARVQKDAVQGPGGIQLRLPGGRWSLGDGLLRLTRGTAGPWGVQAVTRPAPAQLRGAQVLGAASGRRGHWDRKGRVLWLDLGSGHWLRVTGVDEGSAYELVDQLRFSAGTG